MPLDFISVMLNCYLALRKSSIIHQRVKFELYQEEHADTHFFLKNLPKISRNRTQTITRSLILIITCRIFKNNFQIKEIAIDKC